MWLKTPSKKVLDEFRDLCDAIDARATQRALTEVLEVLKSCREENGLKDENEDHWDTLVDHLYDILYAMEDDELAADAAKIKTLEKQIASLTKKKGA